jgi:hypothetical protein
VAADQIKHGKSVLVANDGLAVDQAGANRELANAIVIKGKRAEKSFPACVISRTLVASRRARIRKPSCLISCSHSGPDGGRSAREGRQGGIWPRGRRAPGFTMGLGDRAVQGHWRGCFAVSSPEPANSATPLWVQRRYLASVLVTDYATKRIGNPSAICRGQS